MINCDTDIVAEILHQVREILGVETFALWFGEMVSLSLETGKNRKGKLMVDSAMEYVTSWNRKNYKNVIARITAEIVGEPCDILFRTVATEESRTAPKSHPGMKSPACSKSQSAPQEKKTSTGSARTSRAGSGNAAPARTGKPAPVGNLSFLKDLAAGKQPAALKTNQGPKANHVSAPVTVSAAKSNIQPRGTAVQEKPADGMGGEKRKYRSGAAMTGNRTGRQAKTQAGGTHPGTSAAVHAWHDEKNFQAWMEEISAGRFPQVPSVTADVSPRRVSRKNGREVYTLADVQGARAPQGTFQNFVPGPTNSLALTTAAQVLESPGTVPILVFYGETGVGKSHLLEAMHGAGAAAGISAVQVTAGEFVTGYVEAICSKEHQKKLLEEFRSKYRNTKLLIIDDIQHFQDKKGTKGEFLRVLDTLIRMKRQIVLSCDRPLSELGALGKDLISRLSGGVWCRIDRPCQEVRLGIVNQLSAQRGLNITLDARRKLAQVTHGDARELSGMLCRMDLISRATGRQMDVALLDEMLMDTGVSSQKAVRMEDILLAVTKFFGLESDALCSGGRARAISQPRMLAMWLARKFTKKPLQEIGQALGCSSHSTVISAQKKVDKLCLDGEMIQMQDRTVNINDILHRLEEQLRAM